MSSKYRTDHDYYAAFMLIHKYIQITGSYMYNNTIDNCGKSHLLHHLNSISRSL